MFQHFIIVASSYTKGSELVHIAAPEAVKEMKWRTKTPGNCINKTHEVWSIKHPKSDN